MHQRTFRLCSRMACRSWGSPASQAGNSSSRAIAAATDAVSGGTASRMVVATSADIMKHL